MSSDKQTVENQRFEINNFCEREGMKIDGWIEETISGTVDYNDRNLGKLLKKVKKGDLIICAELSRLGRSLFMIMEILNHCMSAEVKVWTIKDGYRLGDDIQSKVLAFAFGLSAEIERNLISQRTKEALARKKSEGVILGRPLGSTSSHCKLSGKQAVIQGLLDEGLSKSEIAKILKVNRNTLARFMTNWMGDNPVGTRERTTLVLAEQEDFIAAQIEAGMSYTEIANGLGISSSTLRQYVVDQMPEIAEIRAKLASQQKHASLKSKLKEQEDFIASEIEAGSSYGDIAEELKISNTALREYVIKQMPEHAEIRKKYEAERRHNAFKNNQSKRTEA